MTTNRNEELNPGFNRTKLTNIKGKRMFNMTSLLKKEATAGDVYYIAMPSMSPDQCIVPDTMIKFKNSNTKSWFKNNLGRLLSEGLNVRIGGEVVYDNTGESIREIYKDLCKSDDKRKSMVEYGIGNENLRKMLSKDDSAVTVYKAEDVLMAKIHDTLKIKLGKIFKNHGPYAPYDMSDVEYRIRLPKADKIMNAQTGESVEGYKLTDITLNTKPSKATNVLKRLKMSMKLEEILDMNTPRC